MKRSINELLRKNIRELEPYSSARDEYSGEGAIFLDANENPYRSVGGGDFNRYPDPIHTKLREKLSGLKGVSSQNIILSHGMDELVDLVIRSFCEPKEDEIIILPPTFGLYKVQADISDVGVREIELTSEFDLDTDRILSEASDRSKVIFIVSPNNPTANIMAPNKMIELLERFPGLVFIDEAYIDFIPEATFRDKISQYPNLIVAETFSKGWGLAGIRLGAGYTNSEIVDILTAVKFPYNLTEHTQRIALAALDHLEEKDRVVAELIAERERVRGELEAQPSVEMIYRSDANFLLVKTTAPVEIHRHLMDNNIIVRKRHTLPHCEGTLRVTIGTREENDQLIEIWSQFNG